MATARSPPNNANLMTPKKEQSLIRFETARDLLPWILMAGVALASAILLNSFGRVWWCAAGDMSPWAWNIWSTHNSQHLIDPYTFTHILHGVLEFWILSLLFSKVPVAWRLAMAVGLEAGWEVFENTNYVINRYREATISLDYFGDSIINSLSDILSCFTGFLIAYKIKFRWSLALFVVTEAILILTIRDSLLINILMLIYPIDAIKQWQIAGV